MEESMSNKCLEYIKVAANSIQYFHIDLDIFYTFPSLTLCPHTIQI